MCSGGYDGGPLSSAGCSEVAWSVLGPLPLQAAERWRGPSLLPARCVRAEEPSGLMLGMASG